MVHIMLPFLILPLYANMKAIDKDCLKAASSLGATPTRAFWTVFFPLSIPGLLAGLLIVFVSVFGLLRNTGGFGWRQGHHGSDENFQ